MKSNKKNTVIIVVVAVVILAIVAYYCYLVNRDRQTLEEQNLTVVQKVLARDLEKDYPPSPKEVIKYYNEVMKCFYNEECSVEEIEALGRQARLLYDDELVENNPWETYLAGLTLEIVQYKETNRRIASASVASSTDVEYFTDDGYEFARIRCGYSFTTGKTNESTVEVYLLRQDEDKHWKIYGWDLAENVYAE
ncbi:MAG: hypothetical protein IJ324_12490 [Lachnospiraceae bacterium]|nr:hypothetical protein [Lachnospiraceae bacterium]